MVKHRATCVPGYRRRWHLHLVLRYSRRTCASYKVRRHRSPPFRRLRPLKFAGPPSWRSDLRSYHMAMGLLPQVSLINLFQKVRALMVCSQHSSRDRLACSHRLAHASRLSIHGQTRAFKLQTQLGFCPKDRFHRRYYTARRLRPPGCCVGGRWH